MVKANCARASRTASNPGMPTSSAWLPDEYACDRVCGSSRLADRLRPHLRQAAHPDHLAEVALDQMHLGAWHLGHGDLDMDDLTGTMRPHTIGDQVAPGERLQETDEQARCGVRIEHESDGYMGIV